MSRFVLYCCYLVAFYIAESSCTTNAPSSPLPKLQFNETSGNLLDGFGLLNILTPDIQNGLKDFLNGLLQGGTGENKWTPGKTEEKPYQKLNDSFGIGQLLPLLGLSDPMKLIPVVFSYLQSKDPVLEAYGVSDMCRKDLNLLYQGLQRFEGWAWKIIDSSFKIPSNLAGYNLKWLGDMDECISIATSTVDNVTGTNENFSGKYCRLLFPFGDADMGLSGILILGSCASTRCSNNDVKIIVDSLLTAIPQNILSTKSPIEATVSCIEDKPKLDSPAITATCVLAVLATLVLLGTIYDVIVIQMTSDESKPPVLLSTIPRESPPPYLAYVEMPNEGVSNRGYTFTDNEKSDIPSFINSNTKMQLSNSDNYMHEERPAQPKSVAGKLLVSFSAYTNGCKLLGTNQGSGSLGAINGLRFLSMAWIILGHTYYYATPYVANMIPVSSKKINQWTFAAIINASTSVDTFFALSGTLVAYLTLREMKKAGGASRFNWFMFYFHRFWRLTPPYMLVLMVGTVLYQYFVYGPMQQEKDNLFMADCRENWWTNLLYVNNYVNLDKMCMGWTWYLANDMQMYIVSPLILVPFFYNVVAGGIMSVLFLAGTMSATAIIENDIKYPIQPWSPYAPKAAEGADFNRQLYIPVWTRLGPYVIGLVTGYALYRCRCKFRIPKVVNLTCWVLCLGIVFSTVYGPYSKDDNHIFSHAESTAYMTLFRVGWGLAICWIIFACATGHGGWINGLLSWSPYVPLGRLTYCAYLLHPLVMMVYYENRNRPVFFSDYGIIYLFLGNLVLSYGAAFVASLFFESPMMGLEKAVFKRK